MPTDQLEHVVQVNQYVTEANGTVSAEDSHCIFIGLDDYVSALFGAQVRPAVVVAFIQQGVVNLYKAGART